MRKLLVICGPTATGKTSLGVKLAQKFNGEIISADSRQVYKGMDLITGKDINKQISKFQINKSISNITNDEFQIGCYEVNGVKIWMLDVVKPNQQFNVADYCELAWVVVGDIWERKKLPIVVGGTGFYIKSLLEGVGTMGIPPDWELREKLQRCKVSKLQRILENLDLERIRRMNESDRKNPRRLIRAIEIATKSQSSKFIRQLADQSSKLRIDDLLFIGLSAPHKELYERVDQRVEERVKAGAEDEIRGLLNIGYNWDNSVLGVTIGYREWRDYFEGKITPVPVPHRMVQDGTGFRRAPSGTRFRLGNSEEATGFSPWRLTKDEVIQKWKYAEHNYARRQMTWFKKMSEINWFDITEKDFQKKVEKLVRNWYI